MGLAQDAALFDPLAQGVFRFEILFGCRDHALGWTQAIALPCEAPFDRLGQDTVTLRVQFLCQLAISSLGRDRHRERNQVQTPLHGLVHIAD